jgi:hypothetical protein
VVYGPLLNGGTSVLFESTPTYPDPGRYWETVQRLGINQFYGSPTAIRLLIKYGDEFVTKYDKSSLKTLGSVCFLFLKRFLTRHFLSRQGLLRIRMPPGGAQTKNINKV